MYMYLTTPEPGNPRYPREGLAATMRGKVALRAGDPRSSPSRSPTTTAWSIARWSRCCWKARGIAAGVAVLGDAAHATTPHLGQGAGMAIEDSLVLAEELARHDEVAPALDAWFRRRFERCALHRARQPRHLPRPARRGPAGGQRQGDRRDVRLHRPTDLRSMPMSRVTEIRYVGYGVTDFDAERRFYADDWGLERSAGRGRHGLVHAPPGSDEPSCRAAAPLRRQPSRRDRAGRRQPRPMSTRCTRKRRGAGCRIVHAPRELDAPGGGYGFRFFSPDGLPFEISSDVARRPRRDVERWEGLPVRISHIVLHSPDHPAAVQFFTEVLGFRGQRLAGRFHVLPALQFGASPRCAILPGPPCLNHVAYDMTDVDGMMRGVGPAEGSAAPTCAGGRAGTPPATTPSAIS